MKSTDFGVNLNRLQTLKLSKNEITTIEDETFVTLEKLSHLDLSFNKLKVKILILI